MAQHENKVVRRHSKASPQVEEAIAWLQTKKDSMEAELTLRAREIGEYLIRNFFDDDLNEVTSQNPNKNVSFRELCERVDLPFPESALRRFIHVAINFRLMPPEKARALPPSHHSVLYHVADPDERCRIGIEAADNELSVRKLRQMVKGKGRRRPGAGRKRTSDFYKNWKQLVGALDQLTAECDGEPEIEETRYHELRRESREVRDQLNRIIDKLIDLKEEEAEAES